MTLLGQPTLPGLLYLTMILCLPAHQLRMLLQLFQLQLLKEVRLFYALLRETHRFYKKKLMKMNTIVCISILPKANSRLKMDINSLIEIFWRIPTS